MPFILLGLVAVAGLGYRRLTARLRLAEELLDITSKCARSTEQTLQELLVHCFRNGPAGPAAFWTELAGWLEHVETEGRAKERYQPLFVNAGLCRWTYTPDSLRVSGVALTKAGRRLLANARVAARAQARAAAQAVDSGPTTCTVCLAYYGADYTGVCMCDAGHA